MVFDFGEMSFRNYFVVTGVRPYWPSHCIA